MRRNSTLSIVFSLWLLPLVAWGQSAGGKVYDLASDFSAEKNPNGAWTVGTFNHNYTGKVDDLQNLTTYVPLKFTPTTNAVGGSGLRGWGNFSAGFLGLGASASGVVKNTGTSASYSVPPGAVAVFPQNGPVVVRWTAPKDGKVSIRARFANLTWDTDNAGFPEVWILLNQDVTTPLLYQKACYGTGKLRPSGIGIDHVCVVGWGDPKVIYQKEVTVTAKVTLDFVVDPMYTLCVDHSEHPDGNGTDIIGLTASIRYESEGVATK